MFLFEKSFYGFFLLLLSVQMLSWPLLHGNSCGASSFDDLSPQTPFLSTTRQITSQDAPPTLQRTDSFSLTAHPTHTHLQTVLWAAGSFEKSLALCAACAPLFCRHHKHNFTCVVSNKKMHNARKREQINQKIFALEKYFEQFCQMHAQKECSKVPALWQSLSGQPPCNEDLCPGRFVPNETEETSLGVFKTLEEIGREAIEICQMQQRRQGASPLALFEQQHCEDACVAKAITS